MRPGSILLSVSVLVILSACAETTTEPIPPPTTTQVRPVDLTDPATQAALGSPPPSDFTWQRPVAGLTIVGTTAAADPVEIDLVDAALSDLPEQLLTIAAPRFFVRVPDLAGAESPSSAVTVTLGPDVYLLDRTFSDGAHRTSRLDLTYALAHELTHVAQWFRLEAAYAGRVQTGEVPNVQLSAGSSLVSQYAAAVGWVDESAGADTPAWLLSSGTAPTQYAATSPVEDLAEAVALVSSGRANWIDDTRLRWIEAWLGATADELAAGMPWIPAGSQEIRPASPLFDERLATDLATSRGAKHIEPVSFSLYRPDAAALADEIEEQLRQRGLEGTLGFSGGGEFPRYQGTFTRTDGTVVLVELWDFTEADDEAALTYVVIW